MSSFDTATLNLGRHTPQTAAQRDEARAGIAKCEADFAACEVRFGDALIGTGKFWRAGYELRYHELLAARKAALQRTCDDCGAAPGEACTWDCSSNWK